MRGVDCGDGFMGVSVQLFSHVQLFASGSAPASQPLTAHRALQDLPGQQLGQPEHLHFNSQRGNLCHPMVGPQGSLAHLLLVIKDGRWPREGAEREGPAPSTPVATGTQ